MSGSEDEEAEEELETDGRALVERIVITLRYYKAYIVIKPFVWIETKLHNLTNI